MSFVFFFLRNVSILGFCLFRVGDGEEGEEEEDRVGGGFFLFMVFEEGKKKVIYYISLY